MTTFNADCRDAAMSLFKDYAASASVKLQAYRARPASVTPPTGFVDRLSQSINVIAPASYQQDVTVEFVMVWGLFDGGTAVDQRDAFVDGFLAWIAGRYGEAGANTTIRVSGVEDDPSFVNDWMKPELQRTFYATRFSLEGFQGA